MKVLILGGCGFIGSHIVQSFAEDYIPMVVFDVHANPIRSTPMCTYVAGDYSNIDKLDALMAQQAITHVVHLVSTTLPKSSNEDMTYDVNSNVIQTLRLLNLCLRHRVRLLFMSSGGTVYGAPATLPVSEDHTNFPLCSYGIGKLTIEKYLHMYRHLHGLDYVVLRPSNPYGPGQNPVSGQGLIANFIYKLYLDQPLEVWGDGSTVRDFFHVSDLANLVKTALLSKENDIFNAGSGEGTSINTIIEIIKMFIAKPFNVIYKEKRNIDVQKIILDCSRARKTFDWQLKINLIEGIKKYIDWYYSEKSKEISKFKRNSSDA